MKIYVGKQTPQHKGDTSRELIDMWEESGYCEIIRGQVNDVFLWANEPNDVLLYEYDRYDMYPNLPEKWNRGLFGGMQHVSEKSSPWIYWARHPRKLESKINEGILSYEDREIESIFLGKIENPVQLSHRTKHDWGSVVEVFEMPIMMGNSVQWSYSQDEYLDMVSQSKFGLCMAGFGPKCNREIEYMGLGVVPVVTEDVCVTYYDSLIEGEHYFRIKNPDEFNDVVNSTSKFKWKEMSYNCVEWYDRNSSRMGSFKMTERILND